MGRIARSAGLAAILAVACSDLPSEPAEREVPVRVGSVGVDRFNSPVVILEEQDGARLLPIWIGPAEAGSIAAHLQQKPTPRPNFHDLAKRVIQSVNAELVRVVVTELRGGTYYATLSLRTNGRVIDIDVRPSDGIAVAVRLDAPILVRESLLEEVEDDLPEGESPATPGLKL